MGKLRSTPARPILSGSASPSLPTQIWSGGCGLVGHSTTGTRPLSTRRVLWDIPTIRRLQPKSPRVGTDRFDRGRAACVKGQLSTEERRWRDAARYFRGISATFVAFP